MVISMSDDAASGGYFIAMTGDPVLAYSNTLTGSIGVFFGKVDLQELYKKIGVKKDLLTRGRFAAIDSEAKSLDRRRARQAAHGDRGVLSAASSSAWPTAASAPTTISSRWRKAGSGSARKPSRTA